MVCIAWIRPALPALLGLSAATMLPACRSEPRPIPVASSTADPFVETEAVLRDRGFRIDRRDERAGVLTTEPMLSPTGFEIWQPFHGQAEGGGTATLNGLRRSVRVEPAGATVTIERLRRPDRRVIVATRRSVFDAARIHRVGETDHPHAGFWEPFDRDPALESAIDAAGDGSTPADGDAGS